MVMLHDEIKTIQNSVFVFFPKKRTNTRFISKKQNPDKKTSKHVNCFFRTRVFSTLIIFLSFFVIFP